ncbi:MAG: hypothetical protein H6987_19035, partial [Pseudomonadales bacterium]|nr:hypothetical protein [Pseudomonadales bacterium]
MQLQDIAATADVVGAVGVIASMLYLAIQVRQNTRTTRSATLQALSGRLTERLLLVATETDLAQLIALDWEAEELDAVQRTRITYWISAILVDLSDMYNQYRLGVIPYSSLQSRVKVMRQRLFQTEIGQQVWTNLRPVYAPDFV